MPVVECRGRVGEIEEAEQIEELVKARGGELVVK